MLDFVSIGQRIPDIRGWLVVPDTNINYPVVQGTDNDFYLDHLPDGTANRSGSIMLDVENAPDWTDTVNILHGHRMRSGEMFGSLNKFGDAKYAAAHDRMMLYTPEGDYHVQLIAACTVDGVSLGYPTSFKDDAAFERFLRKLTTRSAYQTDVTPTREDRLLLLSTCAYTFDNARFVVLGLLTPMQP